jgi:hypothetical protein
VNFLEGVLNDDLSRVSEAQPREAHIFQVVRCLGSKGLDGKRTARRFPYPVIRAAGGVLSGMLITRVIEPECTDPTWLLNVPLGFEVETSEPLDIHHDRDQPTGVARDARRDRPQPRRREHCEMTILV